SVATGGLHLPARSCAGGKTARPTQFSFGSKYARKVLMPAWAFFRSVQFVSVPPELFWHIEPVRSRTSMMSSGLMPHGEHAVAFTFTSTVLIPNRRMKKV